MEQAVSNPLGTERIGKLLVRFGIPSIISLVVNSLYNMVDQIFIGNGVGYLGNAATNMILPIMTIVLGLVSGILPVISYNYGSGKQERVKKLYQYAVLIGSAVMVAECAVGRSDF